MEEKIEFREIIFLLFKGRKIIATTTIVAVLIACIFSWGILKDKYESKTVIQLSSDVQDMGIISNYIGAEFTPTIYIKRIKNKEVEEAFEEVFEEANVPKLNVSDLMIIHENGSSLIEVVNSSKISPEVAQAQLEILLKEVKREMNDSITVLLENLEKTYLDEAEILSNEISELTVNYNKIVMDNNLPETLVLQTISSSQFIFDYNADHLTGLENITGNLQNELLQLKAEIDTKSTEYKNVLSKYQSVKTGINSFQADLFVREVTKPTLAKQPTGPNKILIVLIGFVVGILMGIFFVLLINYLRESKGNNLN